MGICNLWVERRQPLLSCEFLMGSGEHEDLEYFKFLGRDELLFSLDNWVH